MTENRDNRVLPHQAFETRIKRIAKAFHSWMITRHLSYQDVEFLFRKKGYKKGTAASTLCYFVQNGVVEGYSHQRVPKCLIAIASIEDDEIHAVQQDIDDLLHFKERFVYSKISFKRPFNNSIEI